MTQVVPSYDGDNRSRRGTSISVITVSYNAGAVIGRTIESVLGQTYENIEYIIIDGGSTDDTKEIVSQYKGRIDLFISEPDRGLYHAMNKGLQCATGDYVGWLNADDFFSSPTAIAKIANSADSTPDIISGGVDIIGPPPRERVIRRFRPSRDCVRQLKYGVTPPHPAFYVRRSSVMSKVGLYNEKYRISAEREPLVS